MTTTTIYFVAKAFSNFNVEWNQSDATLTPMFQFFELVSSSPASLFAQSQNSLHKDKEHILLERLRLAYVFVFGCLFWTQVRLHAP